MSRRSATDLLHPSNDDAIGRLLGWAGWLLAALAVFGFMFGALLLASEITATPGPVLPLVSMGVAALILIGAVLIVAGAERVERARRQTTNQENRRDER